MQMNPYLSFKGDCEAAFQFYERCLGGRPGPIFRYGGSPMADQAPADWAEKVMHAGDKLPRVAPDTPMAQVFHEMSAKKLGMTTVVNADGTLAGILTDGDLRRLMEKHGGAVVEMNLADCMTRNPQTIKPGVLASEALTLMEKRRITCVIAVDEQGKVLGVVHLHDLWSTELV